ncbi:two-component regulator propeller domain-containing protein [Gramella sp. KN1008]|uniref:hybrid sensor histidine kinase/response regulator transcription factor n=1 Tax=Gramella sp. KN1008 TaxID=2529298 RepID=UPI001040B6B8|nr:two-component regulator propeller domain-containing protein [Gramella sp. KN1008]TBW28047.1 response regulator [Gramella sp. KN1008]
MRQTAKITLVFFLILLNTNIYSQVRRFHHVTSNQGLSQSEVYCFLKDSRGFMWFGTVDGLNRFDGYSIEIFNTEKNNPNALTNNTVRSLVEDTKGRIWIGTDDGLNMYDPHQEIIKQIIPVSSSSQKLNINTLLIYDTQLYLGTGSGLFRINLDGQFNVEKVLDIKRIDLQTEQGETLGNIVNLKECSLGGLWVQTSSMVSRILFDNQSDKAVIVETPIMDPAFSLFDLAEDNSNNLWVSCSKSGLLRYNIRTKEKYIFKPTDSNYGPSSLKCSDIAVDLLGNVWIGTLDNGLNLITTDQVNNENIEFEYLQYNPYDPSSLNSNLIRTLYSSRDNIVWVGTIGKGVNYFDWDQKNFNNLRINNSTTNGSNFIRAVYMNPGEELWVGTHSNGLYQINRDIKNIDKLGLENKTVFYITSYAENKYFICSDEGLYLIEESENDINILSHEESNATFYIVRGKQGFYWLASFEGLFRLKVNDDKIIVDKNYSLKSKESNHPQNCRVLYFNDESNNLLVGTEGDGLHILSLDDEQEVIKDEKYKSSESDGSISNNYIRSIIKDSHGYFWIGTYEGLNKIITSSLEGEISFKTYTKKDGLPNNMINSIIEDDENSLWIGTNKGLSKYIPTSKLFVNYFESDGIQSNEFSEHTTYKTQNGEIIMGGVNGITTFYPDKINKSKRKPETTITDFYIDGNRIHPNKTFGKNVPLKKGISVADTVNLLPTQNNISFEFSSMLYPDIEKIKYAYMLDGFDKGWQYTEGTTANYTNLDHGSYIFKVKSTNSDGVWEEEGRNLAIHIKTPFKYTWYAYALYFLVIILILVYFSYYSIIRYTTKKKLLLEQEHNHKVQSLNQLRTQFFINISHDLRTPLTLIKAPLDSILKEKNLNHDLKEKLFLIRRNVKRLNYLVEQLLDVRRTENQKLVAHLKEQDIIAFTKKEISHFTYAFRKKGLRWNVNSPFSSLIIGFDSGMLSKVYFNLISNALKYTEYGEVDIQISEVQKYEHAILANSPYDSFIKVEISDTGKGIPREKLKLVFDRFYQEDTAYGKGYGIGLSHTYQLIEAHDGFIEAESEENKGTTFRFFIPHVNTSSTGNKAVGSGEDDIYRIENEIPAKKIKPVKDSAKTVLIVEDNADMRSYIKSELINKYNILEAADGIQGIERAENYDIDLIISDLMMPNMDGMSFCHHIKTNLKTSHIPIILLTAKIDKQSKYKGIETGADDYITKPFEMEYLSLRIENLLQSREKLRKIFQAKGSFLKPSAVTVNSMDEKFLKELMEYIEKGIPDSEFNVNSLEKKLGMSHSNFYRKVKSLTGQSGKEILDEMRMNRAKQILRDNNKIRINEVAYMVGFTNPKYFGKNFKETFGVSPSDMKRQNIS